MADNELNLKITGTDQLSPVFAQALESIATSTQKTNEVLSSMSNSLENLGGKSDNVGEKTSGLNVGMINLSSALSVVKLGYDMVMAAMEKVSALFGQAIEEAVEAEKAQNKLSGALVATGNFTEKYVKQIDAYVKTTEAATGVSGEWIQTTIASGVQMGLSVDKAQQLEQAARQLAATTGRDLNEALSLLQGSLAGQTRGLAKIFPQINELTKGQLKQGDALKLVTQLTEAQYKLYEGSYSASLQKAKNALSNVLEEIGKIIIQNPIVKKGLDLFTQGAIALQQKIEVLSRWIQVNQETIERLATAFIQVLQLAITPFQIAFEALSVIWKAAPGLVTAIGVALVAMTGPVGVVLTAVSALTFAFAKWPGLFDMITGVFKQMVGFLLNSMSVLGSGVAKLVSVFNDDLAESISGSMKALDEYSIQLANTGQQQQAYGETINETKEITFQNVEAIKEETIVLDENLKTTSANVAAKKQLADSYAGIIIGTTAMREAMETEVQQRDADLKKFEDFLTNKMRLAVGKAEEQRNALLKFQSEQTTGGGAEDKSADAANAIAQEEVKQKGLNAAVQAGAMTRTQYEEELFQSQQRIGQQRIIIATAQSQELADALGDSPAGLQAKLSVKQQFADKDLALQISHLERLKASTEQIESVRAQATYAKELEKIALRKQLDDQIVAQASLHANMLAQVLGNTPEAMQAKIEAENQAYQAKVQLMQQRFDEEQTGELARKSATEQAELEHNNRLQDIKTGFWDGQAEAQAKAGNDWEAMLARMRAAQEREGKIIGTLHALQNSTMYKGTQTMLTDLSSLRSSHSKKAFEIGKGAAIAQATVNTFMAATAAFSAMAGIPIVGPALGAVAAAAAIAAGVVNIQKITAQKFQGGQADEGMDNIPQSLSGKSFVLSQGERVVQPQANSDLKDFLNREKMGNSTTSGPQYNITLHYNGTGSRGDVQGMADMLIDEIRKRSERGTPIISSKGVTS